MLLLAYAADCQHHLGVESKWPHESIIGSQTPEQIAKLLKAKEIAFGVHVAGLDASRCHFYAFEEFVINERREINQIRNSLDLEPLPNEASGELGHLANEIPNDKATLNYRIADVNRTIKYLQDAEETLSQYHRALADKLEELENEEHTQT